MRRDNESSFWWSENTPCWRKKSHFGEGVDRRRELFFSCFKRKKRQPASLLLALETIEAKTNPSLTTWSETRTGFYYYFYTPMIWKLTNYVFLHENHHLNSFSPNIWRFLTIKANKFLFQHCYQSHNLILNGVTINHFYTKQKRSCLKHCLTVLFFLSFWINLTVFCLLTLMTKCLLWHTASSVTQQWKIVWLSIRRTDTKRDSLIAKEYCNLFSLFHNLTLQTSRQNVKINAVL